MRGYVTPTADSPHQDESQVAAYAICHAKIQDS
jgi:hypothetical protein